MLIIASVICIYFGKRYLILQRLQPVGYAAAGADVLENGGLLAVLTSMESNLRSGASLMQAYEAITAQPLHLYDLREDRMQKILQKYALPYENTSYVRMVAYELCIVFRITKELGCGAAQCCNAVINSYKRLLQTYDLRTKAYALPQATATLLSLLPLITVGAGYVFGANPLQFLFGSLTGLICVFTGVGLYAIGVIWVQNLMHTHEHN